MDKVKAFFKWLFANKKSLSGTIVGAAGAGLGITAAWTLESLPVILLNGFNIAPILYTLAFVVGFVLNELGISGKGFESVKTYIERKLIEQEKAEQAALEKKALASIEADKAAKAAIEQKAKDQIKADQEAKLIQQKKAELLAKMNTNNK